MNDIARIGLAVLAMMLATGASAQTFKCVDAAGKITYSSSSCANLGLKDAGEVRNQLNTSPAQRVVPFEPAPQPSAAPPAATAGAPAAAAKAKEERRCFKTAKGMRCNDDPPETDAVPGDAKSRGETKASN